MKRLLVAASLLATPSFAETPPRYDRALERSVMKIVADRIGDLRGGFGFAERPVLIVPVQQRQADTRDGWVDGLAPARQRVVVVPADGA